MIRVTMELIPQGNEAYKRTLGTMEIANDGTGNASTGNYEGTLHAEYTMPSGRKGRVTSFNRKGQSVWSLVGTFLKLWGHPPATMTSEPAQIICVREDGRDPRTVHPMAPVDEQAKEYPTVKDWPGLRVSTTALFQASGSWATSQ